MFGILYFTLNGIDAKKNLKFKDQASLFSLFLRSPCMIEVCLFLIKEQVSENGSIVGTHRNGDCLLKNTPIKHNKYVVNKKKTIILVSENI
jgi:hypothetical protein